jgi:hypothetical protein
MDFESALRLTGRQHLPNPEELADHLVDVLTWRQLRLLAKRNKIHQYSYLNKKGLAKLLAYQAFNRASRYPQINGLLSPESAKV